MHTVHPVFHMFIFKSIIPNVFSSQSKPLLLPVMIEDESEYEIF